MFLYLYLEREREHVCMWGRGREREREREKIPSRLWAVSTKCDLGLDLMNSEIMT